MTTEVKNTGGVAAERMAGFVTRLENLQTQKDELTADMKEVMEAAKGAGFDPKIIRIVLRDRKLGTGECAERDALIEVYKRALGMFVDTPLGQSALRRI